LQPTRRKREQRPRRRGQRVSADDKKLSLSPAIAEMASKQFQQTRNRFCQSFDNPDRARGGAKTRREEDRQQRIDYFA